MMYPGSSITFTLVWLQARGVGEQAMAPIKATLKAYRKLPTLTASGAPKISLGAAPVPPQLRPRPVAVAL